MVCKDSPGSLLGSRKNFGVELKIELNLWEDHLRKKKNKKKISGKHSSSFSIFLKLDFFKMADFCYGKWLVGNLMENIFTKEVHVESHCFQGYLRKTIPNLAITVK